MGNNQSEKSRGFAYLWTHFWTVQNSVEDPVKWSGCPEYYTKEVCDTQWPNPTKGEVILNGATILAMISMCAPVIILWFRAKWYEGPYRKPFFRWWKSENPLNTWWLYHYYQDKLWYGFTYRIMGWKLPDYVEVTSDFTQSDDSAPESEDEDYIHWADEADVIDGKIWVEDLCMFWMEELVDNHRKELWQYELECQAVRIRNDRARINREAQEKMYASARSYDSDNTERTFSFSRGESDKATHTQAKKATYNDVKVQVTDGQIADIIHLAGTLVTNSEVKEVKHTEPRTTKSHVQTVYVQTSGIQIERTNIHDTTDEDDAHNAFTRKVFVAFPIGEGRFVTIAMRAESHPPKVTKNTRVPVPLLDAYNDVDKLEYKSVYAAPSECSTSDSVSEIGSDMTDFDPNLDVQIEDVLDYFFGDDGLHLLQAKVIFSPYGLVIKRRESEPKFTQIVRHDRDTLFKQLALDTRGMNDAQFIEYMREGPLTLADVADSGKAVCAPNMKAHVDGATLRSVNLHVSMKSGLTAGALETTAIKRRVSLASLKNFDDPLDLSPLRKSADDLDVEMAEEQIQRMKVQDSIAIASLRPRDDGEPNLPTWNRYEDFEHIKVQSQRVLKENQWFDGAGSERPGPGSIIEIGDDVSDEEDVSRPFSRVLSDDEPDDDQLDDDEFEDDKEEWDVYADDPVYYEDDPALYPEPDGPSEKATHPLSIIAEAVLTVRLKNKTGFIAGEHSQFDGLSDCRVGNTHQAFLDAHRTVSGNVMPIQEEPEEDVKSDGSSDSSASTIIHTEQPETMSNNDDACHSTRTLEDNVAAEALLYLSKGVVTDKAVSISNKGGFNLAKARSFGGTFLGNSSESFARRLFAVAQRPPSPVKEVWQNDWLSDDGGAGYATSTSLPSGMPTDSGNMGGVVLFHEDSGVPGNRGNDCGASTSTVGHVPVNNNGKGKALDFDGLVVNGYIVDGPTRVVEDQQQSQPTSVYDSIPGYANDDINLQAMGMRWNGYRMPCENLDRKLRGRAHVAIRLEISNGDLFTKLFFGNGHNEDDGYFSVQRFGVPIKVIDRDSCRLHAQPDRKGIVMLDVITNEGTTTHMVTEVTCVDGCIFSYIENKVEEDEEEDYGGKPFSYYRRENRGWHVDNGIIDMLGTTGGKAFLTLKGRYRLQRDVPMADFTAFNSATAVDYEAPTTQQEPERNPTPIRWIESAAEAAPIGELSAFNKESLFVLEAPVIAQEVELESIASPPFHMETEAEVIPMVDFTFRNSDATIANEAHNAVEVPERSTSLRYHSEYVAELVSMVDFSAINNHDGPIDPDVASTPEESERRVTPDPIVKASAFSNEAPATPAESERTASLSDQIEVQVEVVNDHANDPAKHIAVHLVTETGTRLALNRKWHHTSPPGTPLYFVQNKSNDQPQPLKNHVCVTLDRDGSVCVEIFGKVVAQRRIVKIRCADGCLWSYRKGCSPKFSYVRVENHLGEVCNDHVRAKEEADGLAMHLMRYDDGSTAYEVPVTVYGNSYDDTLPASVLSFGYPLGDDDQDDDGDDASSSLHSGDVNDDLSDTDAPGEDVEDDNQFTGGGGTSNSRAIESNDGNFSSKQARHRHSKESGALRMVKAENICNDDEQADRQEASEQHAADAESAQEALYSWDEEDEAESEVNTDESTIQRQAESKAVAEPVTHQHADEDALGVKSFATEERLVYFRNQVDSRPDQFKIFQKREMKLISTEEVRTYQDKSTGIYHAEKRGLTRDWDSFVITQFHMKDGTTLRLNKVEEADRGQTDHSRPYYARIGSKGPEEDELWLKKSVVVYEKVKMGSRNGPPRHYFRLPTQKEHGQLLQENMCKMEKLIIADGEGVIDRSIPRVMGFISETFRIYVITGGMKYGSFKLTWDRHFKALDEGECTVYRRSDGVFVVDEFDPHGDPNVPVVGGKFFKIILRFGLTDGVILKQATNEYGDTHYPRGPGLVDEMEFKSDGSSLYDRGGSFTYDGQVYWDIKLKGEVRLPMAEPGPVVDRTPKHRQKDLGSYKPIKRYGITLKDNGNTPVDYNTDTIEAATDNFGSGLDPTRTLEDGPAADRAANLISAMNLKDIKSPSSTFDPNQAINQSSGTVRRCKCALDGVKSAILKKKERLPEQPIFIICGFVSANGVHYERNGTRRMEFSSYLSNGALREIITVKMFEDLNGGCFVEKIAFMGGLQSSMITQFNISDGSTLFMQQAGSGRMCYSQRGGPVNELVGYINIEGYRSPFTSMRQYFTVKDEEPDPHIKTFDGPGDERPMRLSRRVRQHQTMQSFDGDSDERPQPRPRSPPAMQAFDGASDKRPPHRIHSPRILKSFDSFGDERPDRIRSPSPFPQSSKGADHKRPSRRDEQPLVIPSWDDDDNDSDDDDNDDDDWDERPPSPPKSSRRGQRQEQQDEEAHERAYNASFVRPKMHFRQSKGKPDHLRMEDPEYQPGEDGMWPDEVARHGKLARSKVRQWHEYLPEGLLDVLDGLEVKEEDEEVDEDNIAILQKLKPSKGPTAVDWDHENDLEYETRVATEAAEAAAKEAEKNPPPSPPAHRKKKPLKRKKSIYAKRTTKAPIVKEPRISKGPLGSIPDRIHEVVRDLTSGLKPTKETQNSSLERKVSRKLGRTDSKRAAAEKAAAERAARGASFEKARVEQAAAEAAAAEKVRPSEAEQASQKAEENTDEYQRATDAELGRLAKEKILGVVRLEDFVEAKQLSEGVAVHSFITDTKHTYIKDGREFNCFYPNKRGYLKLIPSNDTARLVRDKQGTCFALHEDGQQRKIIRLKLTDGTILHCRHWGLDRFSYSQTVAFQECDFAKPYAAVDELRPLYVEGKAIKTIKSDKSDESDKSMNSVESVKSTTSIKVAGLAKLSKLSKSVKLDNNDEEDWEDDEDDKVGEDDLEDDEGDKEGKDDWEDGELREILLLDDLERYQAELDAKHPPGMSSCRVADELQGFKTEGGWMYFRNIETPDFFFVLHQNARVAVSVVYESEVTLCLHDVGRVHLYSEADSDDSPKLSAKARPQIFIYGTLVELPHGSCEDPSHDNDADRAPHYDLVVELHFKDGIVKRPYQRVNGKMDYGTEEEIAEYQISILEQVAEQNGPIDFIKCCTTDRGDKVWFTEHHYLVVQGPHYRSNVARPLPKDMAKFGRVEGLVYLTTWKRNGQLCFYRVLTKWMEIDGHMVELVVDENGLKRYKRSLSNERFLGPTPEIPEGPDSVPTMEQFIAKTNADAKTLSRAQRALSLPPLASNMSQHEAACRDSAATVPIPDDDPAEYEEPEVELEVHAVSEGTVDEEISFENTVVQPRIKEITRYRFSTSKGWIFGKDDEFSKLFAIVDNEFMPTVNRHGECENVELYAQSPHEEDDPRPISKDRCGLRIAKNGVVWMRAWDEHGITIFLDTVETWKDSDSSIVRWKKNESVDYGSGAYYRIDGLVWDDDSSSNEEDEVLDTNCANLSIRDADDFSSAAAIQSPTFAFGSDSEPDNTAVDTEEQLPVNRQLFAHHEPEDIVSADGNVDDRSPRTVSQRILSVRDQIHGRMRCSSSDYSADGSLPKKETQASTVASGSWNAVGNINDASSVYSQSDGGGGLHPRLGRSSAKISSVQLPVSGSAYRQEIPRSSVYGSSPPVRRRSDEVSVTPQIMRHGSLGARIHTAPSSPGELQGQVNIMSGDSHVLSPEKKISRSYISNLGIGGLGLLIEESAEDSDSSGEFVRQGELDDPFNRKDGLWIGD